MLKKILLVLLISCISASSFAYQVKADLIIDNQTGADMWINVKQPNRQDDINQAIPAHKVTRVTKSQNDFGDPLENGMSYKLSLAQSHAFITISGTGYDRDKIYLQGRVTYRAGAEAEDKWSFLDNISVAPGLSFDPAYTCRSANTYKYPYNYPFNNQIVISGIPENSKEVIPPSNEDGLCQGFKSASVGAYENKPSYTPVCFDGTSSVVSQIITCDFGSLRAGCFTKQYPAYRTYYNGRQIYYFDYSLVGTPNLKAELDKSVGNPFCETWTKS